MFKAVWNIKLQNFHLWMVLHNCRQNQPMTERSHIKDENTISFLKSGFLKKEIVLLQQMGKYVVSLFLLQNTHTQKEINLFFLNNNYLVMEQHSEMSHFLITHLLSSPHSVVCEQFIKCWSSGMCLSLGWTRELCKQFIKEIIYSYLGEYLPSLFYAEKQ